MTHCQSQEELTVLKEIFDIREPDVKACCRWLLEKYGLHFMILTAGADYSLILAPGIESHIKTPRVKVVDTVGAGDAFTGAFIAAILQGKSLEEAHRSAVDRSAFVCTQPGAWVTASPGTPVD